MTPNRVRARTIQEPPKGSNGIKLDSQRIQQICALVKEGAGFDVALDYLGIQNTVFWKWMRKGEAYLRAGNMPEKHAKYGEFVIKLRQAHAELILEHTRGLSGKGWFKHMLVLERKDRKNWSRRDPQGGTIENYDPNEKFL